MSNPTSAENEDAELNWGVIVKMYFVGSVLCIILGTLHYLNIWTDVLEGFWIIVSNMFAV